MCRPSCFREIYQCLASTRAAAVGYEAREAGAEEQHGRRFWDYSWRDRPLINRATERTAARNTPRDHRVIPTGRARRFRRGRCEDQRGHSASPGRIVEVDLDTQL